MPITKGSSLAWETNKNNKSHFLPRTRSGFTVNVDFWFSTMISVKNLKAKKTVIFVVFL